MKKFKLILFLALGAFLFNSCEDKDDDKPVTNIIAINKITNMMWNFRKDF